MKHNFYIIAKVFEHQLDGRVARDHYGNAKTKPVVTSVEAETLHDAHEIGEKIADDTGHDWLEFHICSEAEKMWRDGQPAFFDMEALKGLKRLKGIAQ